MTGPESGRDTPPSKTAVPPVIVKKGKGGDDDDETASAAPPPRQKILPTGLSRSIVIAAIVASLAVGITGLFANRYDLVPAPNSANGFMYRIDRLLGNVQFCGPQGCSDLPKPDK